MLFQLWLFWNLSLLLHLWILQHPRFKGYVAYRNHFKSQFQPNSHYPILLYVRFSLGCNFLSTHWRSWMQWGFFFFFLLVPDFQTLDVGVSWNAPLERVFKLAPACNFGTRCWNWVKVIKVLKCWPWRIFEHFQSLYVNSKLECLKYRLLI